MNWSCGCCGFYVFPWDLLAQLSLEEATQVGWAGLVSRPAPWHLLARLSTEGAHAGGFCCTLWDQGNDSRYA